MCISLSYHPLLEFGIIATIGRINRYLFLKQLLFWRLFLQYNPRNMHTVFALLCFVVVIHWLIFPYSSGLLTSLALWQSIDCPSASKATLMNMDKYFMWIHYERLHNHKKTKHNKTVCIFLGIYCSFVRPIGCILHQSAGRPNIKTLCCRYRIPIINITVSHNFSLTHWGRDQIYAVSQTTFSNAFSRTKMNEFFIGFHWSLFLRFDLTIFQHWFR